MPADLLPCPFCGSQPVTRTDSARQVYSVECPKCVSVGFHNHYRFGCMADAQWNERANAMEEKILQPTTAKAQNLPLDCVGIPSDSERGKLSRI